MIHVLFYVVIAIVLVLMLLTVVVKRGKNAKLFKTPDDLSALAKAKEKRERKAKIICRQGDVRFIQGE